MVRKLPTRVALKVPRALKVPPALKPMALKVPLALKHTQVALKVHLARTLTLALK